MLFNSWPFVSLVVCTVTAYYYIGRTENRQVAILIAASMIFYSYGQPLLLLLLLGSIFINALATFTINNAHSRLTAKIVATLGIAANLLVLASFKYAGLLVGMFISDPHSGQGLASILVQLPLPIGISFYTFQGISLLVDSYTGDFERRKSRESFSSCLRDTLFFISFFPQLVAGPVLKAKQFIPQISLKKWTQIEWISVSHCLITGYFLKMVVADNLKDQTFWIQFPYFQWRSSADLLTMLTAYSAQIFADFAGYSLIAIGVAALFGYQLPRNFNFPYISTSVTEFWRRWHISLSSWLKEYLYLPLGGNRRGSVRTYVNLIIVMFLGGLWHGAAVSFAIWGLWHGVGLALERPLFKFSNAKGVNAGVIDSKMFTLTVQGVRWLYVFSFVTLGWLFFKLTNFSEAISFLQALLSNTHKPASPILVIVCGVLVAPVFIYHAMYLLRKVHGTRFESQAGFWYGAMLFLIVFNSGSAASFVYFQF